MYRIIGGDGREYGPVTGDTIRQWVVQNRANAKTLVRPDTSADWRPLGEIPEFAGSFGAPPPQPPPPPPQVGEPTVAPGGAYAPGSTPQPQAHVDPKELAARLTSRESGLTIGDCISDGFRLLGRAYWPAVGVTFLVTLCASLLGAIPILGILASLLLTHVFYAGLYYYFIKLSRGEEATVADGFSGFSRSFGHLVLLSLVMQILIGILILPALIPILGASLWQWNPFVMIPLGIVLAIPVIYLGVGWFFAAMLVIDRGMEFWDAMEVSRKVVSKCWFTVFFLTIIVALIGLSGLLGLIIGVIFTLPIIYATLACAYETLFPQE